MERVFDSLKQIGGHTVFLNKLKFNSIIICISTIVAFFSVVDTGNAERFFQQHSTWYEEIPKNPPINPESDEIISDWIANSQIGFYIENFSRPVYVADDNAMANPTEINILNWICDPNHGRPECPALTALGYNNQAEAIISKGWNIVPLPSNAQSMYNDLSCDDPNTWRDNQIVVYNKDKTESWSIIGYTNCAADSPYAIKMGTDGGPAAAVTRKFTTASDGVEGTEGPLTYNTWPGHSGPMPQYDYLGSISLGYKPYNHGMLTYDEVVNDTIDHALEFITDNHRETTNGYWQTYPAVAYGNGSAGLSRPYAPIAGQRFQLNMTEAEIDAYVTFENMSIYHKRVLYALKKYGMIFVDATFYKATGIMAEQLKYSANYHAGDPSGYSDRGWGGIFTVNGSNNLYFPNIFNKPWRVIEPLRPPFNTSQAYQCSDGIDNDSDGLTDYPNDPGCSSPTDNDESNITQTYQCSDNADNDNDDLIDYPDDPGCSSATDNDEYNTPTSTACQFTEPDCDDTDINIHPGAIEICDDDIDNDCDGKIDQSDPECSSACSLANAYWNPTSTSEGAQVSLIVTGTGCAGKELYFEIYEADLLSPDDFIEATVNPVTFTGNVLEIEWEAQWRCDGKLWGTCWAGDPEFYFKATLVSDASKTISSPKDSASLLHVSQGTCVDNDRDGYGAGCALGPDCDDNDSAKNIYCGLGNVYYVDQAPGSDCAGNYNVASRNCTGSDGESFDTIQEALNSAQVSDTVFVRTGTYQEHDLIFAGSPTRESERITLKSFNNEEVIIDPSRLTSELGTFSIADPNDCGAGSRACDANSESVYILKNGANKNLLPEEAYMILAQATDSTWRVIPKLDQEAGEWTDWNKYINIARDAKGESNYIWPWFLGIEAVSYSDTAGRLFVRYQNSDDVSAKTIKWAGNWKGISLVNKNYITIDGVTIRGCRIGIYVDNSDYITVKNSILEGGNSAVYVKGDSDNNIYNHNIIHGAWLSDLYTPGSWEGTAIRYPGGVPDTSSACRYEPDIYGCVSNNKVDAAANAYRRLKYEIGEHKGATSFSSDETRNGIYFYQAGSNNIVSNNTAYNLNMHLKIVNTHDAEVYGNTFYNCSTSSIDPYGSRRLKIHDNLFYNNNYVIRKSYGYSFTSGFEFYNNRSWNYPYTGKHFYYSQKNPVAVPRIWEDDRIYNNTFLGAAAFMGRSNCSDSSSSTLADCDYLRNTLVINNIIATPLVDAGSAWSSDEFRCGYNWIGGLGTINGTNYYTNACKSRSSNVKVDNEYIWDRNVLPSSWLVPNDSYGTVDIGVDMTNDFYADDDYPGVSPPSTLYSAMTSPHPIVGAAYDAGAYEYENLSCLLTSASWIPTSTIEGDSVQLTVIGNNCGGQMLSFNILEYDPFSADEPVATNPQNAVFTGNTATARWTAEWQNDPAIGDNNPEFYFTATLVSDSVKTISSPKDSASLLHVSQAVGTACADNDGDGYGVGSNLTGCSGSTTVPDCDDSNANINSGAMEVCGNGVDEDCSGADMACGAATHPTANPNANQKTREILDYFYSLPVKSDKKIVSGQFFGNESEYQSSVIGLYSQTGIWPAILGSDYYSACWTCFGIYDWVNAYLIDHWNKGGLVTLSIHYPNPYTMVTMEPDPSNPDLWIGESWDRRYIDVNDMLTPGTYANTNYIKLLDTTAAGLLELQNAGVTVIYRNFHEMNGGWFWWGNGNVSVSDYIRLWKHQFNYFTYTKGLNNLLWTYAANKNYNGNIDVLEFYPGDAYVDIVGFDYYGNSPQTDSLIDSDYARLKTVGKPVIFAEFGPQRTKDDYINGTNKFDYLKFLDVLKIKTPDIAFFQTWQNKYSPIANLNAQQFLSDPIMINRGDLNLSP